MKKFVSILLVLVLMMSLSVAAFAEGTTDQGNTSTTYRDQTTVTLTKNYELTNAGTKSPEETFTFSALKCIDVKDAGVGVTTENAPVPTIGSVSYNAGDAGSANKTKNITINLPEYTAVGVYTYEFSENDGATAGVTYRNDTIKLVVTVIEQDGKVRVATIHTEQSGDKSASFDNTYSAGSLTVKKVVTGLLGDQNKEFTVRVKFTAPEGDTVREAITYGNSSIAAGWTGEKEVVITLTHNQTITFGNIPYGVTYTVVEDDYTTAGYKAAAYDSTDADTVINTASETVTITNQKDGQIDMGVSMDSLPYILMLVVVGAAVVVIATRKKGEQF